MKGAVGQWWDRTANYLAPLSGPQRRVAGERIGRNAANLPCFL
jgi:hypothetical protein